MTDTRFRGAMVALVTPFQQDGSLDEKALAGLVEFHIENGTHGLVICGTTGESATMTPEERTQAVRLAVQQARRRIPVIAGTGSSNTRLSLELSQAAKEASADGLLLLTPPYNKPTQRGLLDYFNTVINEVKLPSILYNVPGRTGVNLLPATIEQLAPNPYVVGVKEATASMAVASEIIERCQDQIELISGDDVTAFPLLCLGGSGVISVTSNIAPRDMAGMINAWQAGDLVRARQLHYKMLPLHRAMFLESNPIPVKTALYLMGRLELHLRSPLVPMEEDNTESLRRTMQDYGDLL